MRITYTQLSNTGDRSINEDSVRSVVLDERYCFILCDGLGGHVGGELASQCVCKTLGDCFLQQNSDISADNLLSLVSQSQDKLIRQQEVFGISDSMRTTLCCVILSGAATVAGYIGDSRIYQFRNGKVINRTQDHSVTQHLVNMGVITEQEIRHHEDRNRLLRVMGTEWEAMQFQIWDGLSSLQSGDALLLCSDGFWEWIEEAEMEALLSVSENVEAWLSRMRETVEKHGHGQDMDNYSAIAVWVQ